MRRKMFIKNIVYKKWYIVFCVYIIFINLCKKTLTSRNAQNFLRAKIFYTFLFFFSFKAHRERKNFYFSTNFNKFQSALIKNKANTTQESAKNVKSTKNKKITQNCEQPPNRTAKSAKKRINIDNRTKKC